MRPDPSRRGDVEATGSAVSGARRGTSTAKLALDERGLHRASMWLTMGTFAVGATNYVFWLGLARLLPAHEFVVVAAGQGLLLVAGTLASASVPWVLARALAVGSADRVARATSTSFAVRVALLQGIAIAAGLMLISLGFADAPQAATIALGGFVLSVGLVSTGYLQGTGRLRPLALLLVVEALVKLGSGLALVQSGAGSIGALLATSIGAFPLLVVTVVALRAEGGFRVSALRVRSLWRDVFGNAGVQALVALVGAADVVVAATVLGDSRRVAALQLAVAFGRVPLFVAGAVSAAVFARMSRECQSRRLRQAALATQLRLSLAVAVVVATLPDHLLALVLPAQHQLVREFLPIVAVAGLGFGLTNLISTFFQAARRFRRAGIVLLVAGALHVTALVVAAKLGGPLTLAYADLVGALAIAFFLWWSDADRSPMAPSLLPAAPVWLAIAAVAATQTLPVAWLVAVAVLGVLALRSRPSAHSGRSVGPGRTAGVARREGERALHR